MCKSCNQKDKRSKKDKCKCKKDKKEKSDCGCQDKKKVKKEKDDCGCKDKKKDDCGCKPCQDIELPECVKQILRGKGCGDRFECKKVCFPVFPPCPPRPIPRPDDDGKSLSVNLGAVSIGGNPFITVPPAGTGGAPFTLAPYSEANNSGDLPGLDDATGVFTAPAPGTYNVGVNVQLGQVSGLNPGDTVTVQLIVASPLGLATVQKEAFVNANILGVVVAQTISFTDNLRLEAGSMVRIGVINGTAGTHSILVGANPSQPTTGLTIIKA